MGEHILYLKCQHFKKAVEIHELLLFLWSCMDLSSPGCFLAVFSRGATWALLSTPYCSRPLRKRTVARGCKDVLADPGGHRSSFGHLQAGKYLGLQQAALMFPGTAKGAILPCSLLSEQAYTQTGMGI